MYTDADLYVPGKIILLQSVHIRDGRCVLPQISGELSIVEESEYAQTVCTTYEQAGETNKRILASEISPHDLGEFYQTKLGLWTTDFMDIYSTRQYLLRCTYRMDLVRNS